MLKPYALRAKCLALASSEGKASRVPAALFIFFSQFFQLHSAGDQQSQRKKKKSRDC